MPLDNTEKENAILLEDALLSISCSEKEEIINYKEKIDAIINDFDAWAKKNSKKYEVSNKEDEKAVAKSLFDYFWDSKLLRYDGEFLLSKVIDNQLLDNNYQGVGNCLGLTSLYSVICVRKGIWGMKILESSNHILNCYDNIFIENTLDSGFDADNEKYLGFQKHDLTQLIVSSCINNGIEKGKIKKFEEAIGDFDEAIKLNPKDSRAYNNRGIAKTELEKYIGAIRDFDEAIKLNPNNSNARINMENAKAQLKKYKEIINLNH
jgi:tetratricopeptide (TPR) repeat protein